MDPEVPVEKTTAFVVLSTSTVLVRAQHGMGAARGRWIGAIGLDLVALVPGGLVAILVLMVFRRCMPTGRGATDRRER